MPLPRPNTDESVVDAPFIGNFHKTLPHNEFGEVEAGAYRKFERTCEAIEAGAPINFEEVPRGPVVHPAQSAFHPSADQSVARLTSPLAGAGTESHGPDPRSLEMLPAPGIRSMTTTAEMVELYWMALLRDAPLVALQAQQSAPQAGEAAIDGHTADLGYTVSARVGAAVAAVNRVFDTAVSHDADAGRLRTPTDVAGGPGGANLTLATLFRSGLRDEHFGPLVSQFFLRPIGYGTQTIDQKQVPYAAKVDFLTSHGDWLLAQNTGKDRYGRDYGICNNYADQLAAILPDLYYPTTTGTPDGPPVRRYISTMRDLARFVNRDALHQAYFNAALFLLGIGARVDAGNPYRGNRFSREGAFASLGDPDLLTLVSEVATRALKVVWRQKWLVHRRCRPEVFGGLLQMQLETMNRDYGLTLDVPAVPDFAIQLNKTLDAVRDHNNLLNGGTNTLFLPMAFSAGSPSHPAYGAGHATVAGACVTVLKAWFDEDERLAEVFGRYNGKVQKDPGPPMLEILQPGYRTTAPGLEDFAEPAAYTGTDAEQMTVGGELNKIASNVAMGRSMGGVHWRTDNTRSLRLGEEIGIEILRKRTADYAERPVSFTFRSFDGRPVYITRGQVERD